MIVDKIYYTDEDSNYPRFFDEVYTQNCYGNLPGKDLTLIDCGACFGFFSFKYYEQAKVIYAFEPYQVNYENLKKTLEENHLNKIKLSAEAVWSKSGKHDFYAHQGAGGKSLLGTDKIGIVKTIKLSDVIKRENISHIDCLKIDTEGAENEILNDLEKFAPITDRIVMECHGGNNPEERLTQNGYKYSVNGQIWIAIK